MNMRPIPIPTFPLKGKEGHGRQSLKVVVDRIAREATKIKQMNLPPFQGEGQGWGWVA